MNVIMKVYNLHSQSNKSVKVTMLLSIVLGAKEEKLTVSTLMSNT